MTDSEKVITERLALANKIVRMMEEHSPGDEELHQHALMLAYHASTGIRELKSLFGS